MHQKDGQPRLVTAVSAAIWQFVCEKAQSQAGYFHFLPITSYLRKVSSNSLIVQLCTLNLVKNKKSLFIYCSRIALQVGMCPYVVLLTKMPRSETDKTFPLFPQTLISTA
jgi:hypothetical protein